MTSENPRASELRRIGWAFIALAAMGALLIGVIAWSIEALLIGVGLMSAGLAAGAILVETMGLLPRGGHPSGRRPLLICLLLAGAVLEIVALLLKASHTTDTLPAAAGLVCSIAASSIAARLLTT